MKIEIDLTQCKYEFLVLLLSDRHSLSTENKAAILAELHRRIYNSENVEQPH